MNKLGENLKKLISNAKLSENELARRVGLPQQMINRIISGKNTNPKLDTLSPIASYFMISISQLIGEDELQLKTRVSSTHQGWKNVPLLDIKAINAKTIHHLLAHPIDTIKTDVELSDDGFAILMNDASMEPRFPKDTLLFFDPHIEIKNGKFCLIFSYLESVIFRQLLVNKSGIKIKCLNPSYTSFESVALHAKDKIIGMLVQARIDY